MASNKLNPFDPPADSKQDAAEAGSAFKYWRFSAIVWLGIKIAVLMGLITFLSNRFDLSVDQNGQLVKPFTQRPILEVVVCFLAVFWLYIEAILVARKIPDSIRLSAVIVGFAVLFRVMMFVSTPIQEVDIYRYIWDGIVLSEGISPFEYSPEQVRLTPPGHTHADPQLRQLVSRYRQGHGAADALNLVHFGQVKTVYPPVSQVVFAAAAVTTPHDASLLTRLRIMKAWLLMFDMGTVVVLICLLRLLGMPTAYSIAYAWCPLVLKEIGNSGHLDSIAIFLTTLSVFLFVRFIMLPSSPRVSEEKATEIDEDSKIVKTADSKPQVSLPGQPGFLGMLLPVLFLALAIGAKIYAVVLAPLFVFVAIKRLGWQATIVPAVVFIAATTLTCWPILPDFTSPDADDSAQLVADGTPAPKQEEKESGLSLFIKYWEMNDFIFMNTVENLKPSSLGSRKDAWFSVFPEKPRETLSEFVVDNFLTSDDHATEEEARIERQNARGIAPFLTTRFILTTIFIIVALLLAFWAAKQDDSLAFCRAAFLTLAWFWLLAPTQNPWYWLWALPLIPFAKNKTWYLMSGLLFIYYIRFWFEYHFTGVTVADSLTQWLSIELPSWASGISRYQGVDFFDFVVTWLEYLPWFLLLSFETIWGLRRNFSSDQ